MFQLKSYQKRAVDVLTSFLTRCQNLNSVEEAYQQALAEQHMPELVYKDYGFEQVPYVCLRIPTGGGKTVLGSYAIDIAARTYMNTDAPITLWLVPTNTIRLQTAEALKNPSHPYRAKLDTAFKHRVMVLDIDEIEQIRSQDIGNKTIVVVATLATLRVKNTSGRKVYAHKEDFEPHFQKVPINHPLFNELEKISKEDVEANDFLSREDIGTTKFSFANLLMLTRPLVIVDEAHNARTSLTFDTLRRINPSAVIEFTATPNYSSTNGSNVLFHVSASELKAEEMIKLPIVLTEHQNWQDAIRDSVITRNKLELDAQKDTDYIRPIALFQAEAKNGVVTVEVLKNHLIEQLKIPENEIAIATGNQRELDGLNLFDIQCPIKYIITIEALKEGWDCSFAYVFCSVKQVSSSKDAEQLLGRVLRMPYAKRRVIEDLNRAYAHLATSKFSQAAQELTDKLISMGFEEIEISAFLKQQAPSYSGQGDLFDPDGVQEPPQIIESSIVVEHPALPDLSSLSSEEKSQFSMTTTNEESAVIRVTGEITPNIQKILEKPLTKKKEKDSLKQQIRVHNFSIEVAKAPSERGDKFGDLPLVCLQYQGELELVEPQLFLHINDWNLLDYPAELKNFRIEETTNSFSIDIDGKALSYQLADTKNTVTFNQGFLDTTEHDLISWLDRKLQQPDIIQIQLIQFLGKIVKNLLQQPSLSLTALIRNQFPLSRAIATLIKLYRKKAQKQGYQTSLFASNADVCFSEQFVYEFQPDYYPSRPPYYSGRFKFQKHYFPQNQIEDLKAQGEEYECAKVIDAIPAIKHWVRNLSRRDKASFWLPLAHGKFYPDFVCALNDGRMLVVEYKGEVYKSNDDSAEKRAIGNKWADLSHGKCLFIMAVEQDGQGRDVHHQILNIIESETKSK